MTNNTKEDLKFWAKIRGLAWRVRNAKVDNADTAVDNLVEHINSVMTRNSLIDQEKHTINNTSNDELAKYLVSNYSVSNGEANHLAHFIKLREEQKENELLFDLDEIDNKPWRVFRQLAAIMPHYKDIYEDYEAFYAFGGGNVVDKLIAEFKETDDYKNSYFNKEKDNDRS